MDGRGMSWKGRGRVVEGAITGHGSPWKGHGGAWKPMEGPWKDTASRCKDAHVSADIAALSAWESERASEQGKSAVGEVR